VQKTKKEHLNNLHQGFGEIQNSQYPFPSPGMGPIWLELKISIGKYKIKGPEACRVLIRN